MEENKSDQGAFFKIKVAVLIEAVVFLIALVMPVTPSKTGKPFKWPATLDEYFHEVLFAFAIGNIALLLILLFGWFYLKWSRMREKSSDLGLISGDDAADSIQRQVDREGLTGRNHTSSDTNQPS